MPSYGWRNRHTVETIAFGTEITAISAVRPDGETLKLGKPIRDESILNADDHVVIHDLSRGMIEKLRIVSGTIVDEFDPRPEWRYLGEVKLIEVERENGNTEKYSLHSIGVLPFRHSNQYATNTLTFHLPEGDIPL